MKAKQEEDVKEESEELSSLIKLAKGVRNSSILSDLNYSIGAMPLYFSTENKLYFLEDVARCEFCRKEISKIAILVFEWAKKGSGSSRLFYSCFNCKKEIRFNSEATEIKMVVLSHPTRDAIPVFPRAPMITESKNKTAFDFDLLESLKTIDHTRHSLRLSWEGLKIGSDSIFERIEELDSIVENEQQCEEILQLMAEATPQLESGIVLKIENHAHQEVAQPKGCCREIGDRDPDFSRGNRTPGGT